MQFFRFYVMGDRTFDRRSFLRRTSAAGLVGFPTVESLQVGNQQKRTGQDDGGQGDDGEQDGAIKFMQAVLPAGFILDEKLIYRIIVVGDPIQPGERPPPLCFPEGEKQWTARGAVVVKPTETGVLEDKEIGAVNRTRVHLENPVEPGSVWRITGGSYCDGNARVTIHELPPQLSEYFSTEMLDLVEEVQQNDTAENGTVDESIKR